MEEVTLWKPNDQSAVSKSEVSGGYFLKSHTRVQRTAGDVTMNQTAITAVAPGTVIGTGIDVIKPVSIGDIIEYAINGAVSNAAQHTGFDVYTIVGGNPINSFSANGLSASLGSSWGVLSWYMGNTSDYARFGAPAFKTIVSGDIEDGNVTLRLFYVKSTTTARLLFANASNPLNIVIRVWSPFPV